MEQQQQKQPRQPTPPPRSPAPDGATTGGKPSLAAWKKGAAAMTTGVGVPNPAGEAAAAAAAAAEAAAAAAKPKPLSAKARAALNRARAQAPLPGMPGAPPPPRSAPEGPVPLAKQVKDVLDVLREADGAARTWAQVAAELPWFDLTPGGPLHAALLTNPRVDAAGPASDAAAGTLVYRSEHGVRDREGLLRFLRAHPNGVRQASLLDAYRGVLDDIDALCRNKRAFRFFNYDLQGDTLFLADERLAASAPDTDVRALYAETPAPADPADLMAALAAMNQRSALATLSRRKAALPAPEKKKRKRRALQAKAVTNAHMMHLFEGDAPDTIDG